MRRVSKTPGIKRSIALCWLFLVAVAASCAQIVGIEPWKPATRCDELDVDPEACVPPASCTDCLYSQQAVCEPFRMDCVIDSQGTCKEIYSCALPCETSTNSVTCAYDCCDASNGDVKYDAYLTCLCETCQAECGTATFGCETFCD